MSSSNLAESSSDSPLLANESSTDEPKSNRRIVEIVDGVMEWIPFISIQMLIGTYSTPVVLLLGTVLSALVMGLGFVKFLHRKNIAMKAEAAGKARKGMTPVGVFPKTLDMGQLVSFGLLWICAVLSCDYATTDTLCSLLVLWLNCLTTLVMFLITGFSLLRNRPFVLDYVEDEMPPAIFRKMIAQQWFVDMLKQPAVLWTKLLLISTVMAAVEPAWQTWIKLGHHTGTSSDLPEWVLASTNAGQIVPIVYGFICNMKDAKKRTHRSRRLEEVVKGANGVDGGDAVDKNVYPKIDVNVTTNKNKAQSQVPCRIRSLYTSDELKQAATVLNGAFRDDPTLDGFLDRGAVEERHNFFDAAVRSMAYFGMVLGIFAGSADGLETMPKAVLACVPVYSRSQEEVDIFTSWEAWRKHGLKSPANSENDFKLPSQELVELGNMKKQKRNGLYNRNYIYIHFFGADPGIGQGKGFGKALLDYASEIAAAKKIPLVLETTTAFNVSQYEKYGFRVVDRVRNTIDLEKQKNWVLLVKEFD